MISGLGANHAAAGQQLAVELLHVHGAELFEWNFANVRCDVTVDIAAVGLVARRPHLDFADVFKPLVHPLCDIVFAPFAEIQFLILCQRLCQLLFDLGLRLSQHVFEDLLAGFGVDSGSVAALPASVSAFADAALAVASTFCHARNLLCIGHITILFGE